MRIRLSLLLTAVLLLTSGVAGAAEYPRVRIETTAGDFVVELDRGRAPLTVENFLQYAIDGHYDGTIFHRVINNFVVQGGVIRSIVKPNPPSRQFRMNPEMASAMSA
jgi:cyclophilin family peptidyl-prolyl cis-trans isomerase